MQISTQMLKCTKNLFQAPQPSHNCWFTLTCLRAPLTQFHLTKPLCLSTAAGKAQQEWEKSPLANPTHTPSLLLLLENWRRHIPPASDAWAPSPPSSHSWEIKPRSLDLAKWEAECRHSTAWSVLGCEQLHGFRTWVGEKVQMGDSA